MPLQSDLGSILDRFLQEKRSRSGSSGTAEAYERLLRRFFVTVAKPIDQVRPDEVQAFCYDVGPSGREPSKATVSLRLAAISSFYRYLIRMEYLDRNPADRVARVRGELPPARGLCPEEVRRLLAVIDDETPVGKRDRALVLTFVLTGRRRSEILSLKAADITIAGETAFLSYRGKGGKQRRRELPQPCLQAILESLRVRGKELAMMGANEPPFDVSDHGFYMNLRRYLKRAGLPLHGVHLLRHTAAKLRRDSGESVEAVSEFLDHANLSVTATYLKRLVGETDTGWRKVAEKLL